MTAEQDKTSNEPLASANAGRDSVPSEARAVREDCARREKFPRPLVLIIESDDLLRWALTEAAGDSGYATLTAPDVDAARESRDERLLEATVVLVDCDATRGNRDGLTALRARLPAPAFALLTDDQEAGGRARVDGLGDSAVFVKPFDLLAIQAYLRSLVADRGSTKAVARQLSGTYTEER